MPSVDLIDPSIINTTSKRPTETEQLAYMLAEYLY